MKEQSHSINIFAIAFGCVIGWGSFFIQGTSFLPKSGFWGSAPGFLLAAIVALVFCMNYHYLSKTFPESEGTYSYVKETLGSDHAFFTVWVMLLAYITVLWANSCAFSNVIRFFGGDVLLSGFHYSVAGREIYISEILVNVAVVFICGRIIRKGRENALTLIRICSAGLILAVVCLFFWILFTSDLTALSPSGFTATGITTYGTQILSVAVLSPWLFVGFEMAFQKNGEGKKTPPGTVFKMAVAAIICGMAIYMALLVISALSAEGEPVFQTRHLFFSGGNKAEAVITVLTNPGEKLGQGGAFLVAAAFFCAVITSILGYLLSASSLLYQMSADEIMHPVLKKKNAAGIPENAVRALCILTIFVMFFGQIVIGWVVDISTLCVTIVYGYICVCAYKNANADESFSGRVMGLLGLLTAFLNFILMLVPNQLNFALTAEEYLIFAFWSFAGMVCYYVVLSQDRKGRFGHSVFMCLIMFLLLFFSTDRWSHMMMQEHLGTTDDKEELNTILTTGSLVRILVSLIVLILLYRLFNSILERQRRLDKKAVDAEKDNEAKLSLIMKMSHDIRTPLNAIAGFSDLALHDRKNSEKMADYLGRIHISATHLLSLVNDVLEISRIGSEDGKKSDEPVHLPALMEEWKTVFLARAMAKGHKLEVGSVDLSNEDVVCDWHRLTQAVTILTSGVMRYLPDGGFISISLFQLTPSDGESALYEFQLTAKSIGTLYEIAEVFFDSIQREEIFSDTLQQEGRLDFSLAKLLIERLGGTLELQQTEKDEIKFFITLDFPVAKVSQTEKNIYAEVNFSEKRALVVDDILVNREIAVELMKMYGFEVDEAHHSTAKTYRKVIEYVKSKVEHVKIIGLTATPFRTADSEQGLLSKIYTDGVNHGKAVKDNKGITYKTDLKTLINRSILSRPIFESFSTEEGFGDNLGKDDWDKITHLDILPDDIAAQMAGSAARNKLIVDTYKKNEDTYGKTIVFAVNVVHAITLAKLFNKSGVKAEFIVSDVKDMVTGVTISSKENEKKLESYRTGDTKVLINVNILTEGVDLPETQTVFLARPTVSTILMTQMIGRALRGVEAGGTAYAHIVSFIDDWDEHIAWVNPESLFVDEETDFFDNSVEYQRHELRMIAISKIEEFASILDDSVDTTAIERVPFEKRIPIGMYAFTCLEENGMDHSYQVMVYDSTQGAYEDLMKSLPTLFKDFGVDDEFVDDETLSDMAVQVADTFFTGEMIPPYEETDIIHILMYYAQYEDIPKFYTFKDIDKSKLDVAAIAKHIWDEDMGPRKKAEYVDSIWEDTDDNMLRLFFGRKVYFWRQLDIEMMKLSSPDIFDDEQNVQFGKRDFEDMSLYEIGEHNPNYEKELRDGAFEKALSKDGYYVCAECGLESKNRIPFQVDHIIPLNKGGKSVPDNLQILCRKCNARKSDKL